MSLNQKTIDIIRERCNRKLAEECSSYDGYTIQNFMIEIIIKEYEKMIMEGLFKKRGNK